MQFSDADLLQALRQWTPHAEFRPLQRESISSTLAGRDSLTILPTGGGKSLTYQLPPLVVNKLTVVVSPLIALARDQVCLCALCRPTSNWPHAGSVRVAGVGDGSRWRRSACHGPRSVGPAVVRWLPSALCPGPCHSAGGALPGRGHRGADLEQRDDGPAAQAGAQAAGGMAAVVGAPPASVPAPPRPTHTCRHSRSCLSWCRTSPACACCTPRPSPCAASPSCASTCR